MDARREGARTARRSILSSGRALALVATLLVAFQAAEEEEVFRYDEPETVIEGLEVRAPEAGRLQRLEESLGAGLFQEGRYGPATEIVPAFVDELRALAED